MTEGLRKIWLYLIPLALLAVVATCDTDFNLKNPFDDADSAVDSTSESPTDMDSITGNQTPITDTLSQQAATESPSEPVASNSPTPGVHHGSNGQEMWRLVIGSVPQKEKAEALAAKTGNSNVEIFYVDELSTYRLVYGSYANIQDAQQAFSEIQEKFPEAWMVFF